jgi:hypothetical protein
MKQEVEILILDRYQNGEGCKASKAFLQGFLPLTNSILQQLKRNFWKIADALFRIS